MNIQTMILTCQERASVLAETLARLAATDWGEAPRIWLDPAAATDCLVRITRNTHAALAWFLARADADFVLLLEDDLDFNVHLRWNLERWSPLVGGSLDFASLYNPNIDSLTQGEDYFIADPKACYGSQACILSRAAAGLVLRDWENEIGAPDIKMTRLLAAAGWPLFYHQPSLVQHIGAPSVWGGVPHFAVDFSSDWKRPFSSFSQPV